jgi:hypothetical protein
MVVKIHTVVFWVRPSCGLAGEYSILKEHTASIFRAEDGDFMLPKNININLSGYVCLLYN